MTKTVQTTSHGLPFFAKMVRHGGLLAIYCELDSSDGAEPVAAPSFGVGEAFVATTHLRDMDRADVWRDGRRLPTLRPRAASLQMFDLRRKWRAVMYPPFETVNLQLPHPFLAEVADEVGIVGFDADMVRVADDAIDLPLLGLAQAIAPVFSNPSEASALFAEYVVRAAAVRVLSTYARPARRAARIEKGLAPWQQRRAADMLLDQLGADTSLSDVASACGLSASHFSKAFRLSFGLPPHRWLLRERVHRATEMMTRSSQPLNEIAIACGFVDQSHLTRVFRTVMGLTPAAWRRTQSVLDASEG